MDRRAAAVIVLVIGSAPRRAFAQANRMPRVAVVLSGTVTSDAVRVDAFQRGLQELGYIPGRNISLIYKYANGNLQEIPSVANEVAELKVDVAVAEGSTAAAAIRRADASVPIVMAFSSDPVAARLVDSLARPGGNTTGLSVQATDLAAKQLEILKNIVPQLTSVAVLGDAQGPTYQARMQEIDRASVALNLRIHRVELHDTADLHRAFAMVEAARPGALLALQTPAMVALHRQIADLALRARLPTMYIDSEFPAAGGLVSYGPNYADLFKRTAYYVDRILRGAKPRDLPVEQVERFELVINQRTARQIGLQIPSKMAQQADRVIE